MVTKTKKHNTTEKRRKVKVSELKLNKETVKNLTSSEAKKVKGGRGYSLPRACSDSCATACTNCLACAAGKG